MMEYRLFDTKHDQKSGVQDSAHTPCTMV